MNYRDPTLRNRLAAEYVLGALHGRARWRFERLMAHDRDLQRLVARWTEQLVPIGLGAIERAPSTRLWRAIEAELDRRTPLRGRFERWFGARVPAVRAALAGVAAGLGAAAILFPASLAPTRGGGEVPIPPPPVAGDAFPDSSIAVLLDADGVAVALVTARRGRTTLELRALGERAVAADHELVLWSIASDGAASALARVPSAGVTSVESSLAAPATLVLSLEARAAAPPDRPTPPLVARGPLVRSW